MIQERNVKKGVHREKRMIREMEKEQKKGERGEGQAFSAGTA